MCLLFQLSLCVRRTWRLLRPSATWQQFSGSCHQISPMLGSRIREPSPTSPWWSRRSHLYGSSAFHSNPFFLFASWRDKKQDMRVAPIPRCSLLLFILKHFEEISWLLFQPLIFIYHQVEREDSRVRQEGHASVSDPCRQRAPQAWATAGEPLRPGGPRPETTRGQ